MTEHFWNHLRTWTVGDHSFISSRFVKLAARERELRQEIPIHFVPTQKKFVHVSGPKIGCRKMHNCITIIVGLRNPLSHGPRCPRHALLFDLFDCLELAVPRPLSISPGPKDGIVWHRTPAHPENVGKWDWSSNSFFVDEEARNNLGIKRWSGLVTLRWRMMAIVQNLSVGLQTH